MTYLGRIDMKREEVMKAEVSFPISEKGFVMGKLMNGQGMSTTTRYWSK